jgi:hypothetical protein
MLTRLCFQDDGLAERRYFELISGGKEILILSRMESNPSALLRFESQDEEFTTSLCRDAFFNSRI